MKTDIDILHNIVDNRDNLLPRQSGESFSRCHDVAGLIELEFTTVFVLMSVYNDIQYIIPMLYDVLDDHNLNFVRVDKFTVLSNETRIKFIIDGEEYKMRGYKNCAMVPILHRRLI